MVEIGTVVEENGDIATVAIERSARCDRCHICKLYTDERFACVGAQNIAEAHRGDCVKVRTRHNGFMCLFILNWLLPLVGAGIGYAISTLTDSVAAKIASIACLFIAGVVSAFCIEAFCLKKLRRAKPYIIGICDSVNVQKPAVYNQDSED